MIDIQKVLQLADIEVAKGIVENDGNNRDQKREIEKYWKATWIPDGFEKRLAYCCATQVWLFTTAGIKIRPTALCSDMVAWAKKGGDKNCRALFIEKNPIPGDMGLIDTKQDGFYNHIFLVRAVNGMELTCIEGNTLPSGATTDNDAKNGGVFKKIRHVGIDKISGYIRIVGDENTPGAIPVETSKPSDMEVFLELMRIEMRKSKEAAKGGQIMLNALPDIDLKIDGDWGPKSSLAAEIMYRKYVAR